MIARRDIDENAYPIMVVNGRKCRAEAYENCSFLKGVTKSSKGNMDDVQRLPGRLSAETPAEERRKAK